MTAKLNNLGWIEIQKQLELLKKHDVVVGVLGKSGSDIVNIAAWNHFGTTNIPAVPFLTIAVDKNKAEIKKFSFASIDHIYQGSTAIKELNLLGLFAEGFVTKTIKQIKTPANAPSTVKKKGFDNRLVDSGRLSQSILSEVRRK